MRARLSTRIGALLLLLPPLLLTHATALAQQAPTEPTYADGNIGLKLASTAGHPLAIRVTHFQYNLDDTRCEFSSGRGAAVSIDGALLFSQDYGNLEGYISAVERMYVEAKALKSLRLVKETKLDREPGQWILRELEIVDFNTKFRCIHVYVRDDADFYALMMRCNAREDAKAALAGFECILSGLVVRGIDAKGESEEDGDDQPEPPDEPGPEVRPKQPGKIAPVPGIVYTSAGNERDIYLLKEGENKPVNLTRRPGIDYQPAFSRDGTKIAFVSGRDTDPRVTGHTSGIYTMNADGTDVTWVVKDRNAKNPRWSPDGSQLVYQTTNETTDCYLYVINADGTGRRELVKVPGWICREPDWSPDGGKIAFTGSSGYPADVGIYTVNPDGSERTLIVSSARLGAQGRLPRFSLDGKRIIFTGNGWSQGLGSANEHPDPAGASMICNIDGSDLHFEHMADEARPTFLPKGNKIAFMALHGGDFITSGHGLDVFVKNVNEVPTLNLTKEIGGVFDFDVSPVTSDDPLPKKSLPYDIVFARAAPGNRQDGSDTAPEADLFLICEDGKTFANISQTQTEHCRESAPCWSPDKTKIVFESNQPYWIDGERQGRFAQRNIWIMDADGSNKINLTRYKGEEFNPTWSPDGSTIIFQRRGDNGGLMMMDPTGGSLRKTTGYDDAKRMTWSNDSLIVVQSGAAHGYKMKAAPVTTESPEWTFLEKGSAVDPDWNPTDPAEIAYFGFNEKGNWALLRFNFPGGATAEVVETSRGRHPSWGPDGCRIVFDQNDGMGNSSLLIAHVHKPDPKDLFNLTKVLNLGGHNFDPDWAARCHERPRGEPAEKCFILCCQVEADYVMYMIKADDWTPKEVGRFAAPKFMPDYPVFSARVNRCAVATVEGTGGKILVSSLDGKESKAVVDGLFPCLSPDGRKLAYLSASVPWEVHLFDLEAGGTPMRRQGPKSGPNGDRSSMSWSSDSKTLYFAGDFSESGGWNPTFLYSLGADGAAQRKVWEIPDQRIFRSVRPSPDDRTLLVSCATTAGVDEVYVMNADGSGARKILDGCFLPVGAWSDDGKHVFAVRHSNVLIRCNPDGSDPRQLLQGELNYLHWSVRGERAMLLGKTQNGRQGVIVCGADGSDPATLGKIDQHVLVATWCGESAGDAKVATRKKPVDPGAKVYVLKGGKPSIKDIYGNTEPLSGGWTASATRITHTFEQLVGQIGEEKKLTRFSAALDFQGPPATITEGEEIELSMTVSGDTETQMFGEWRVGRADGTPEGVDCVALQPPGTISPRPTTGKLRFRLAKSLYDLGFNIALTCDKYVEVKWEYELKK